ncbi:MAG TPA: 3-phosphoshikimate 1-carboxyvinyltransferase [Chitinophagales bacterium]|nr:3-phosphoshikimate 1-carboxyvinyltransferase [Chitinophagales bacterium]HRK28620.1 3-phosphoshikimate 1-carboxyvinyltransferase [Chitinophagales bacterium]
MASVLTLFAPENQVISGRLTLDGSKSISNRALIIQALCANKFAIKGLSAADDTQLLQQALQQRLATINVGAAGTTMRFLTAYLATQPGAWLLTGSERMKERPIADLVEALRQLGATITYTQNQGFPPLFIEGKPLSGGAVSMAANVSSQFLSALLLVAPTFKQGVTLRLLTSVISAPYLNMTLQLMNSFGIAYHITDNTIFMPPQSYKPQPLTIEADWSAASYYYAIAALAKEVNLYLYGLLPNSLQADSVLPQLMLPLGVNTQFLPDGGIHLTKNKVKLPDAFAYDFTNCPDIAQTLAVVCAGLQLPANMTGLDTLHIKETNRTAALQTELAKVNALFTGNNHSRNLAFAAPLPNTGMPKFATYHDHRMAMAFAALSMVFTGGIQIENPQVVSKSYPQFWQHLGQIGFRCEESV